MNMLRNFTSRLCSNSFFFNSSIRSESNVQQKLIRNHKDIKILSVDEEAAFKAYLPKFIEDATHKDIILDYPPVNRRLGRFLKYYSPEGKYLRQHLFIDAYKSIAKHYGNLSPENIEQAHKMAWCMELRNDQFMIVDDIADNHEFRRGKKAWSKLEDIGLSSSHDIPLIDFTLFQLLKKYFSHHKNYEGIIDLFMRLEVAVGFVLELETRNFNEFTLERYNDIVQLKVSYFCFKQPFRFATLLADKEHFMNDVTNKVFEHIAWLYGFQNDMLDCYGEDLCGKLGTDIQENRCSGLITMALRKASPVQRKLLEDNYGKCDKEKVKKVKEVFDELDIVGEYYKMEKFIREEILKETEKISDDFTRSLLSKYADVFCFSKKNPV